MIENPIVAFRKAQNWSRTELARRTGLGCHVLRELEIGSTKRMSAKTLELLSYSGIGDDIQKKLDTWNELRNEERKNAALKEKDAQNILQDIPKPEPASLTRQSKTLSRKEVDDLMKTQVKHEDSSMDKSPRKQSSRKNRPAAEVNENDE